jgi:DNA-binding GntR family transcriptional regulator
MTFPHIDPGRSNELLEKRLLPDEVFELLHYRIVTGQFRPGRWLRQQELAEELGVSPTPIREALDRLVSAGLAQRYPYRGVQVHQPTAGETIEAYVMRGLLEVAVARLAALHIDPETLETLHAVLGQMEKLETLEDVPRHRLLNKQLHRTIAEASGNALLAQLHGVALNKFPDWLLYERMFHQREPVPRMPEQSNRDHRALVDAVAAHNPDLAERRARDHLQHVGEELAEMLQIPASLLREKELELWPFLVDR